MTMEDMIWTALFDMLNGKPVEECVHQLVIDLSTMPELDAGISSWFQGGLSFLLTIYIYILFFG